MSLECGLVRLIEEFAGFLFNCITSHSLLVVVVAAVVIGFVVVAADVVAIVFRNRLLDNYQETIITSHEYLA